MLINLHEVLPLSPKELIEGLILWLWGLWVGKRHLKKHVVEPAAERHAEIIAHHEAHAKHLKQLLKDHDDAG
jgi:hypothetical protein